MFVRCGLAPRRGQVPYPVVPAVLLFATGSSVSVALAGHVKGMTTGSAEPVLV